MAEATTRTVTVARKRFELRRDRVERAMRNVLPEPIASHYVVIDRRRYPPKQVLGVVTGLDRADFTSHQARRVLTGLGFPAGRRRQNLVDAGKGSGSDREARSEEARSDGAWHRPRGSAESRRPSAEMLEPFVGQWVATKGEEVLVAAGDPRTVVGWLAAHRQQADSMFRVPVDEFEASGIAPL
jgi:hypothetical protein